MILRTKKFTGILALILIFISGLNAEAQRRRAAYSEDLQKHRPVLPAPKKVTSAEPEQPKTPAQFTVNEKVNAVLDSIDRFNATRMFIDGFTVQIYSGQKKQEALDINKTLMESDLGLKADIQFVQPKFRVIVGKYYTRLEAHRDLYRLQKLFPNAIIIPEKVPVK